jgi:hypothetical protein
MPTEESQNEPTPNGGVRSTCFYLDDEGNPAEKDVATKAEIVEYDAEGNAIHRTYLVSRPREQGSP